jgi:hypothetical protein
MAMMDFLKSTRSAEPPSATEIRRRLDEARELRTVTVQQRDMVALDAAHDEASEDRWQDLDCSVRELDQRIAMLSGALPLAEAREQHAAEQAEMVLRASRMEDYIKQAAEVQRWQDGVLEQLPDAATLTRARDFGHQLAADARDLATWSSDLRVRHPLDPLEAISAALQHRIDRISHARWARGSAITLAESVSPHVKAAIERVTRREKDANVE